MRAEMIPWVLGLTFVVGLALGALFVLAWHVSP
jgi:hypothetical protein